MAAGELSAWSDREPLAAGSSPAGKNGSDATADPAAEPLFVDAPVAFTPGALAPGRSSREPEPLRGATQDAWVIARPDTACSAGSLTLRLEPVAVAELELEAFRGVKRERRGEEKEAAGVAIALAGDAPVELLPAVSTA
jgi:hypothetical protein